MSKGLEGSAINYLFINPEQISMSDNDTSYAEGIVKYTPNKGIMVPIVLLMIGVGFVVATLYIVINYPATISSGIFLAMLLPGALFIALAIYYKKKRGSWSHFEW